MLQELKKESLKKVAALSAILVVITGVLMYVTGFGIFKVFSVNDIYDLDVTELNGKYVDAEVYFIYDYYAYTTKTKSGSRPTTVSKEYIIPIGEEEYMGLYLPQKYISQAEKLMEECGKYLDGKQDTFGESFFVRGTILPMDKESLEFYHEVVGYDTLTDEQKEWFLPYYLKVDYLGKSATSGTYVFSAIALACILAAAYMVIKALTGGYQKDLKNYCALQTDSEHAMEQLDSFYSTTEPVNGIRFGQELIMYQNGAKTVLMRAENLIWAYMKTTQHKTNGIPTGKTHALMLADTNKKRREVSMSEAKVKETLEYIARTYSHVVLGYSDELNKLYQNNMDQFRALCEHKL